MKNLLLGRVLDVMVSVEQSRTVIASCGTVLDSDRVWDSPGQL